MKTAIIMLSIAVFALSAGAGKAIADNDSGSGTLTAKVDTVTMAQAEGENSSISVIDEYGVTVIFDVMPETAIYGPTNDPITLDSIEQNDTVVIEYDKLEGGLGVAKSIKLTE